MTRKQEILMERMGVRSQNPCLYDRLLRLFLEVDPMELDFGNNPDEYEPEVCSFLKASPSLESEEYTQMRLAEVFNNFFGHEDVVEADAKLKRLAKLIYESVSIES